MLNYLEGINKTSTETLEDLFDQYSFDLFHSNAGIRRDLYQRNPAEVRLTEFFGGVTPVELLPAEEANATAERQPAEPQSPSGASIKKAGLARRSSRAKPHVVIDTMLDAKPSGISITSAAVALAILASHIAAWSFLRKPSARRSTDVKKSQ